MTNLNLFALTNDKIWRFSLSADVQRELSAELLAQEKSFNDYVQEELIFDGKYKPDDGECLVINNYDDIDNLYDIVSNPLSVAEISPDPATFSGIKALFVGYTKSDGTKTILLQSFDRRKIISAKGLSIFHSSNVYKKVEGIGLTIDTKLSATLTNSDLRFFSFHTVRQIFDLSQYYTEATDADITAFADIAALNIPDVQKLISQADSWIRRKVSLVTQSGILEAVPMSEILAAAADFNIPLKTTKIGNDEVIVMPSDKKELKQILRFLDEDYYKSTLSRTNFISNSRRKA